MRASVIIFVLLGTTLAGCLGPASPADLSTRSLTFASSRVVVGMVDSGIVPYHHVFQDQTAVLPDDFIDARTGQRPIVVELSKEGSLAERLTKDHDAWANIEPGKLYWFKGTRILAMSLLVSRGNGTPLILDTEDHGTGTASVVKRVAPESWIVMIQNPGFPETGNESTFAAFEKAGEGAGWLADQPWIDVLSLSVGLVGNPPLPLWKSFMEGTRSAVLRGKSVVVAAGNEPVPSILPGNSGPPWVISVGGAQGATNGSQPRYSQLVDVVADFETYVPGREPDSRSLQIGTSFSTPIVAGNLARTLYELRNATQETEGADGVLCRCGGRNVTNVVLRDTLNRTAVYFNTTDYQPQNAPGDPLFQIAFATVPVLPTPWVQMGWGYVGNDTWRGMVAGLLAGKLPERDALAKAYMAEQYGAREAYWRLPHD